MLDEIIKALLQAKKEELPPIESAWLEENTEDTLPDVNSNE